MKKICSLLLVATLVISLAVPAFAEEEVYTLHGNYTFYLILEPWPIIDGTHYKVNFKSNGVSYDGFVLKYASQLGYHTNGGTQVVYEADTYWKNDAFRDISFPSPVTVSKEFYEWFTANAKAPMCDGSTCPATDVNFDDVCDDCGLTLAYNLRQTPNSVELVVKHSDSLTLKYVYTETLAGTAFNAVYADDRVTVTFDNPVNHTQYKKVGDDWELYSTLPNQYGNHVISLSGDASISTSDLDVYNTDGTLFFRNPLWMVVEKVTQGEMTNLLTETGGTMKTLLVCGVGCLALLVVLSLFGKRSLIFRG